MARENKWFIFMLFVSVIVIYQVMLHITAHEIQDRISDLEQETEYLQEQIDDIMFE